MTQAVDTRSRWRPFPLVWLAAAGAIAGLGALQAMAVSGMLSPGDAYVHQDTYYVVSHAHLGVNMIVVFALTAGIYLTFDLFRFRYSAALAWWHCGVTLLGVCLVFAPATFLSLAGMPRRYVDYPVAFSTLNAISQLGYVLALAGLVVFVWLLFDGLVRRAPRAGP